MRVLGPLVHSHVSDSPAEPPRLPPCAHTLPGSAATRRCPETGAELGHYWYSGHRPGRARSPTRGVHGLRAQLARLPARVMPVIPDAYFGVVSDSRTRAQTGYWGWVAELPLVGGFIPPQFSCAAYVPASPGLNTNVTGFCDRRSTSRCPRRSRRPGTGSCRSNHAVAGGGTSRCSRKPQSCPRTTAATSTSCRSVLATTSTTRCGEFCSPSSGSSSRRYRLESSTNGLRARRRPASSAKLGPDLCGCENRTALRECAGLSLDEDKRPRSSGRASHTMAAENAT